MFLRVSSVALKSIMTPGFESRDSVTEGSWKHLEEYLDKYLTKVTGDIYLT